MKVRGPWQRTTAVLALLLGLIATGAQAQEGLRNGGNGRVSAVIDDDTVALTDGRQVRLVGIQAPKLPLGRPDFEAWPLAEDAKRALADLTLEREVSLRYGGLETDRHGRALAHLFLADGTWVQGEMLARGLARVYTFADNRALAAEMLARESMAREARHGIWADPFYALRRAEDMAAHGDGFQVVEGRVRKTAKVRRWIFLNFGADWRSDFTLAVEKPHWQRFEKAGLDPLALEGRPVRVRGWVREWNGPLIEATHPEQIEILGEKPGGGAAPSANVQKQ